MALALTLYVFCSIALAISYLILVLTYLYHWDRSPTLLIPDDFEPRSKISVIIPIRNEAEHIVGLLESIIANHYPKSLLEIIVIDDHSTDESAALVKQLNVDNIKVLSLEEFELPNDFNSYKKFGISKAIEMAQGDFIITTDGDCQVPNRWLYYLAYVFEIKEKSFVAAPVNFTPSRNALVCLLYTSPSPRDLSTSRMPSSA